MTTPPPNDKPPGVDLTLHLGLVFWVADKIVKEYGGRREDYLAEGYLALVDAKRTYVPSKGAFSTHAVRALQWKIVRGLRSDQGRQRANSVKGGFRARPRRLVYDVRQTLNKSGKLTIEDVPYWNALTDRQRTILRLRFVSGLSLRMIAGLLGITHQGVHNNISTALYTLRQSISTSAD